MMLRISVFVDAAVGSGIGVVTGCEARPAADEMLARVRDSRQQQTGAPG